MTRPRDRERRRRHRVALVAVVALAAAACSSGSDEPDKPSREIEERPAPIDYSQAKLEGVPGTTSTSAPLQTGTARIVGLVSGPNGPVAGATVRVEQLLRRGEVVPRDVVSGADGRYLLEGIPGGRYRVRAFVPPVLAVVEPEVRFLEAGKEAVFDLTMTDQRKVVANASVSPEVPYVGDDVNLAVVVATQSVDVDGIVRSTPIPGLRVELDGLGAWSIRRDQPLRTPLNPRATTSTTTGFDGSTIAFTDGSGVVRYQLQCNVGGNPSLGVLVTVTVTPQEVEGQPPPAPEQRVQRVPLELPDCVDPTATTIVLPTTSTTRDTDRSAEDD